MKITPNRQLDGVGGKKVDVPPHSALYKGAIRPKPVFGTAHNPARTLPDIKGV
jgi:hypothetical protein